MYFRKYLLPMLTFVCGWVSSNFCHPTRRISSPLYVCMSRPYHKIYISISFLSFPFPRVPPSRCQPVMAFLFPLPPQFETFSQQPHLPIPFFFLSFSRFFCFSNPGMWCVPGNGNRWDVCRSPGDPTASLKLHMAQTKSISTALLWRSKIACSEDWECLAIYVCLLVFLFAQACKITTFFFAQAYDSAIIGSTT